MARFAGITGRYVYVTVDGVEYRVYFEESGRGIPIVLQHTAGADGRQWRHLLEDPWITERFRLVAHDLPFHGKSLPPPGVEWWKREYTLMAPQSPEQFRQETIWVYSQGAPAVFKGDLDYYALEHDLTGKAKNIDTKKVAVYLLGGEYDWSASPTDVKALADEIRGAKFEEMKELGHFPMCENP